MAEKFHDFDPAEMLDSDEAIETFLAEAMRTGGPLPAAFHHARIRCTASALCSLGKRSLAWSTVPSKSPTWMRLFPQLTAMSSWPGTGTV